VKEVVERPHQFGVRIRIGVDSCELRPNLGQDPLIHCAAGERRRRRLEQHPDVEAVEIVLQRNHADSQDALAVADQQALSFETTERIAQRRPRHAEPRREAPLLDDGSAGQARADDISQQLPIGVLGEAGGRSRLGGFADQERASLVWRPTCVRRMVRISR
jgi:hypothetical protein